MITLQEKLNNLDVIFELAVSKNPLFYYEKQHLINRKTYTFKYFTVDEVARIQKIAEVNKALEGDAMLKDMTGTTAMLNAINEGIEYKKFVVFGSAEAFIDKDELVIKIKTESHKKEFRFNEDEYLDSAMNFIQNEVGKEAKILSSEKQ
jgi:GTPase Era involved in 16S rRNA processing